MAEICVWSIVAPDVFSALRNPGIVITLWIVAQKTCHVLGKASPLVLNGLDKPTCSTVLLAEPVTLRGDTIAPLDRLRIGDDLLCDFPAGEMRDANAGVTELLHARAFPVHPDPMDGFVEGDVLLNSISRIVTHRY